MSITELNMSTTELKESIGQGVSSDNDVHERILGQMKQ